MKKIYLLAAIICCVNTIQTFAQGWAKPVTSGAGTNVYQNFSFDVNGNPIVIGGAEDYSGGAPDGMVFMRLNKTDGSRNINKKYNGRTNAESYKIHHDADGNFYFFGTFTDYIAFGTDTLFTYNRVNWNYANYFLAKFDSIGNHLWSKKFGQKFGTNMNQVLDAHFTQDAFHVVVSYTSDSVFYDNTFQEKLAFVSTNSSNFCLFKINLNDGSLGAYKKIGGYYSSYPKLFTVNTDGSYDFGTMEIAGSKKFTIYNFTTTNAPALKCSTNIVDKSNGTGHDLEQGVWYDRHYYILAINNGGEGWSTYNSDTVKTLPSPYNLSTGILLKFDGNFKLVDHKRFHWTSKYPKLWLSGNKLIVAARFTNTMYMEQDSMTSTNNQHSWNVMAYRTDLSLADTMQINTANSSGGSFDVVNAAYDANGNLYAQVVHNKDIKFYGTTVFAAQKSWDHLTVLVRKGENLSTGINEVEQEQAALVYPNPAKDIITLKLGVSDYTITDLLGKQVLSGQAEQINISQLPNGVYILNSTQNQKNYRCRFIKQH